MLPGLNVNLQPQTEAALPAPDLSISPIVFEAPLEGVQDNVALSKEFQTPLNSQEQPEALLCWQRELPPVQAIPREEFGSLELHVGAVQGLLWSCALVPVSG